MLTFSHFIEWMVALQVLDPIFAWINKRVQATESAFDDVVVPIAKTFSVILIVILTLVYIGRPFGLDFTGLLPVLVLEEWP